MRETSEALRTCGEDSQTPGRSLRSHYPRLEAVLVRMLEERGLRVGRQVSVAFDFNGMHFDEILRVSQKVGGTREDAILREMENFLLEL